MKEDLLKIINQYGVFNQLKKLNEECYELIEAINDYIYEIDPEEGQNCFNHIEEEFADVMVVLEQFKALYELDNDKIVDIMYSKIERQLERIEKGESHE